ncbi:MAG TPA: phenylalanine--tRNA ligase subunit beta [Hungateiclostridium thermocellum]|mgnify:CR=1 FL=1|jgi:phenylalanyl-tRNA synthetase beta chain|uniref:Phenylalanine--tRNA ligase beta subunit n=2 Tax=Acetivibrio thermocellus TaxID=1515 RepID=A3DBX7_ACET2|nr:phenylalanine--tRNA ligase subunit beta [Acetivibrio thermocellus]CDG34895.1 Phenylalanine-tRNA ligase beta subunit [Acetivibrio thermocellus BC1]ABN51456.1 phenylalanyl-tRNA synthetase, beta subunit [Acetivibrio thermocellus ATCC 27405]ADU75061.1 phenylalanyl-tRNA synthetase, beta subunit [Acetivibrio thermocellus DSM 1313]ALX09036.1 Phenylalanyl-tRNA synthetase beta chain [Acetivibrio thermocellus AD2]ANV76785.1 Phenylalanyl-tRNA synthetase beta chain [Acetivibrio thermocellus DSM 2360]
MKAPIDWLKDYVDINVSTKELADAMTMSGSKVEGIEVQGEEITKVVVGKILSLEKHPDADRLQVAKVDVGSEVLQIVTGAQNVNVGDYIPVALVGSTLPGGKKISKGKLRGVESYGMMCSIEELGLTRDDCPDAPEDGIYILPKEEELGKDIKEVLGLNKEIIEFEITSNRPDCLSIIGLAREAAVTLKTKFKRPVINVKEEGDDASQYISVEVKDTGLCPRFAARVVKDVKIGPSPKWMRDRLKAAGVRPINNIVDITNYVMLEYGQPMHAYDIKDIKGNKIIVRRAFDGEIIKTLDDQDRELDSSMLVIADEERAVGVAGVMGGANSEIKDDTKTIVFEAANFNGTSVRLTAKKLGMRTEASGRFEKGLDPENVEAAINRAAQLVEELGIGTVCKGMIDCYPEKKEPRIIKLRVDKINSLLGTNIPKEEMIDILRALEFEVDENNMTVKVPTFRDDVEREADIAEEIARFYGYNNIEATLLSGKTATQGRKTYKQTIEDLIKETMIACGLCETYTFSFTSPKVFDKLNLPADSELRKAVVISNPLGEDYSIMRTTTIPDMLAVISTNYNRRIEEARLFEMSKVYIPKSLPLEELPEEKTVLTLGMYGELDFYDLKGVVEELLERLGIKNYDVSPEKNNVVFHPGRTALINIDGEYAGIIGEIHPEVAEKFECPERTYIGVIEVETLVRKASMDCQYKGLPKYPAVTRDIAMLVKDEVMVKEIEDIIKQRAGKILESVKLFDVYKGKQVPEGMKSVAYSITFRASDRTLTDEEVGKAMTKILDGLKRNLGAELR